MVAADREPVRPKANRTGKNQQKKEAAMSLRGMHLPPFALGLSNRRAKSRIRPARILIEALSHLPPRRSDYNPPEKRIQSRTFETARTDSKRPGPRALQRFFQDPADRLLGAMRQDGRLGFIVPCIINNGRLHMPSSPTRALGRAASTGARAMRRTPLLRDKRCSRPNDITSHRSHPA